MFREIPQRVTWASALWVTRRGDVYRRFYNGVQCTWQWGEIVDVAMEETSGRIGYYLSWWTSIEMVIALAWRRRAVDSPSRVWLEGNDLHARWIHWSEEEEDIEEDVRVQLQGETWKKLRWACGIVPCPEGYSISSQGRLKNPSGEITAGSWFQALETRMASIRGCGMVDLLVAARIKPNAVYLAPRLKQAIDCMLSGYGPNDMADETGLLLDTAWGYCTKAAVYLRPSDLKRHVPRIVCGELWRVLTEMRNTADPLFSGTLTHLLPAVEEILPRRCSFRESEHKMSELRLARMTLAAQRSS